MDNLKTLKLQLNIDEKLLFDFFFVFSRFEYALKLAGYLCDKKKTATADWDKFAKNVLKNMIHTKR